MKVLKHVRKCGLESSLRLGLMLAVKHGFIHYVNPSLNAINANVGSTFRDVNDLISTLLNLRDLELLELQKEYSKTLEIIKNRLDRTQLPYPDAFAIAEDSGFLIYSIVRTVKPELFLETGVANGMTSSLILSAMKSNGNGTLISVDISEDVGQLIPVDLRSVWDLRILKRPFRKGFLDLLSSIHSVDIFCHDSDHSYAWQSFEYNSVKSHLRKGGMILSDDIDGSYAFIDFIRDKKVRSYSLIDTRKVFGIVTF